ncbi:MAG: DUF2087 domain-containing protein [Clostridiaceae bacterium]|nr:DUF2087 domain-containing protein [Clostridiaceae bacterium]
MGFLNRFLDADGKITAWASKQEARLEILKYISAKFQSGRFYSEKEVNAIIEQWHTFDDYFLIRRGLIDSRLLSRTNSGSRYWVEERESSRSIIELLESYYDIGKIKSIFYISNGYGSDPYYVLSEKGEYIFKDINISPMNNPDNEALILQKLEQNGIPVSQIAQTVNGGHVLKTENKTYHLQKYIEGKIYSRNTAPEWLLYESARMLGKIQNAMEALPLLPLGISQSFFDNITPEKAILKHRSSLQLALQKNDVDIANAACCKIHMLETCSYKFDVQKMTCCNTHGDYKIQQIICGKDKINAVIDFTSACIHPICWEIIRSYSLADEKCINGSIDIDNLKRYISCFLEYGHLTTYDIKIMPYLYFYQSLTSDYFGQYYALNSGNRDISLNDAFHSLKLCKWFYNNITRLEDELASAF